MSFTGTGDQPLVKYYNRPLLRVDSFLLILGWGVESMRALTDAILKNNIKDNNHNY